MNQLNVLLLTVLSVFVKPVAAAPTINIKTEYYPVSGTDSISIQQSIQRNGPIGEDGKRYHAYTKWHTRWSYEWLETATHCQLTRIEVSIDISYLLPELKEPGNTTESFRRNWDRYYQALYRHEQQHKDYGVQAAVELERELLAIKNQQNCTTLKKQLENTANRVLDKYDKIEKEFDRITNHGLNQGVKLR